jgi:hypothetical protein
VVVETVRREDAAPEAGITLAGEKVQDSTGGGLEHESETGLSKGPDFEATTMLEVTAWPGVRLTEDGEAVSVTDGAADGGDGGAGDGDGGGRGQLAA